MAAYSKRSPPGAPLSLLRMSAAVERTQGQVRTRGWSKGNQKEQASWCLDSGGALQQLGNKEATMQTGGSRWLVRPGLWGKDAQ